MTDGATFKSAMRKARLRQTDLSRLTGKDRRTVWRWCNDHSPVPDYAWTIVRQQERIKKLTSDLMAAS